MTAANAVAAGTPPPDGRLWAFATTVYARSGVAAVIPSLQDDHGADVVLLLFGAWAGAEGLTLTGERMETAAGSVAAWRGEVVTTLRILRRRLKAGPAPGPSGETEALRQAVKDAELAAERIELAALERTAAPWLDSGARAGVEAAVANNLVLAFESVAGRPPDQAAAGLLRTVAEAAR
jgi:uncharacterized protein (TIGR02444 family)